MRLLKEHLDKDKYEAEPPSFFFSNTKGLILLKKRYVLITILIIFVFMVVCGYISHKNKKEHYIQTQEKRIDLYFKYNLKDYHSMHVTSFKRIRWADIL